MTPTARFDFGIGVQVGVLASVDGDESPWPGEPSGVIVQAGGSAIQSVSNSGGPTRMWIVDFDEPQVDRDGSGPHDRAQIAEKFLELAPPMDA